MGRKNGLWNTAVDSIDLYLILSFHIFFFMSPFAMNNNLAKYRTDRSQTFTF